MEIKKLKNIREMFDLFLTITNINNMSGGFLEPIKELQIDLLKRISQILNDTINPITPENKSLETKEINFVQIHRKITSIMTNKFKKDLSVIIEWDIESLLEELDACIKTEQIILSNIVITNTDNLKEGIDWLNTKKKR